VGRQRGEEEEEEEEEGREKLNCMWKSHMSTHKHTHIHR